MNIMYATSLLFSNIMYNLNINELVDKKMEKLCRSSDGTDSEINITLLRVSNRIVVYSVEALIALYYNNIVKSMNILGCIFCVCIGYFYPYVMYREIFQYKITQKKKILNIIIFLFGTGMGILGLVFTIMNN